MWCGANLTAMSADVEQQRRVLLQHRPTGYVQRGVCWRWLSLQSLLLLQRRAYAPSALECPRQVAQLAVSQGDGYHHGATSLVDVGTCARTLTLPNQQVLFSGFLIAQPQMVTLMYPNEAYDPADKVLANILAGDGGFALALVRLSRVFVLLISSYPRLSSALPRAFPARASSYWA